MHDVKISRTSTAEVCCWALACLAVAQMRVQLLTPVYFSAYGVII